MGRRHYGQLIVLEGPDGVGKSTLSRLLVGRLHEMGRSAQLVTFPGREPMTLGNLVYRIHHDPTELGVNEITELAKQALHIAAHLDVIDAKIIPLLKAGTDVILDRYWWSTLVYGSVGGGDISILNKLIAVEKAAWGRFGAKTAILIRRTEPIERDVKIEEWASLLETYEGVARKENAVVIENEDSLETALAGILAVIETRSNPQESQQAVASQAEPAHSFSILKRFSPAKPSIVMETFWRFAVKRQEIYFQRLLGSLRPWTDDAILAKHKFTNVYRAADRVSQYLIRQVIYGEGRPSSSREVLFRILLYKLFNKIETWELLESKLGDLIWETFDFDDYDRVLTEAMAQGTRIYSAAYIMPPGGSAFGHVSKHQNHLALIQKMISDELAMKLEGSKRMQDGFELLVEYPTIGDFLGYQLITDVNYSELTSYSEMEFVVPGPGARDGLRKAFTDLGGLTEAELIRFVADHQDECFEALGLTFKDLFGRKLQLIDCQNLFCEVDKYSRLAHPEIVGITGRTRIKQLFSPNTTPMDVWFPPKWRINENMGESMILGPGGLI